jgi:two-component system sensor histidine kinase/response regulator
MTSSATILVIDDSADNRLMMATALEGDGYRVVLADGGEVGISAFARARPDCVLLDVVMPGTDGLATCVRIRALPGGADVPIVFVTALRDVETFDRAVDAGGDDFLTKPFRRAELMSRVSVALSLGRLTAERNSLYALVRKQRDELVRLQLQKEQIATFLVHDLKAPVNGIALVAERVLRDHDATEPSREAAAKIRDDARVLARMITTLLDLARSDEAELSLDRSPVDLEGLIGGVVDELAIRAHAAGVSLSADVETITVSIDHELVRRVFENLIDNAIRHAPEGSTIFVTARPSDDGIELRVTDAGPGVAADLRERVFERFVQVGHKPRSTHGLGLAFCKLAVEAHGGRIWIEDGSPGATFCVWIAHTQQAMRSVCAGGSA